MVQHRRQAQASAETTVFGHRSARALICAMAFQVTAASAGTLSGTVRTADGAPLAGVMVTVGDDRSGIRESVFTGPEGEFVLDTKLHGSLLLRTRKPYFRDSTESIELEPKQHRTVDLKLAAMEMSAEISDSLPAAYHFGRIEFSSAPPFDQGNFRRDCLTCHQLGNTFTRLQMPPEAWAVIVRQMHVWLGNGDDDLTTRRAELLARAFDGRPADVRPVFPVDPALYSARITQYRLDRASVPHDAEIDPRTGLVFTADEGADWMIVTDRETGESRYIPAPARGSPIGGKFGTPLLFNLQVARGPHSMALGPDGKFYVTEAIGGGIGVFDPAKQAWEEPISFEGAALYPHTIRFDRKGYGWFTIAYSDQVGRLDPVTRRVTVLQAPKLKALGAAAVTVPYGIDVNPVDGSIWFARLFGDSLGRIDPDTLAIEDIPSPVRGPRRMRFDASGRLWIAGFVDGDLGALDTATMRSRVYPLPEFAKGYAPAPYALAIHPRTGDVWINEVMTDRLYRFMPREERFIAYPMPLQDTYTREISFAADGSLCTSNNPIPRAALEGGVLELICLDPEGVTSKVRQDGLEPVAQQRLQFNTSRARESQRLERAPLPVQIAADHRRRDR